MASNQDKSGRITFFEKYQCAEMWYEKVIIMEIYHFVRLQQYRNWTISQTAEDFGVSVGLASENLRIADAIHRNQDLINCKTRQDALRRIL